MQTSGARSAHPPNVHLGAVDAGAGLSALEQLQLTRAADGLGAGAAAEFADERLRSLHRLIQADGVPV
jgi:hypothetical protein